VAIKNLPVEYANEIISVVASDMGGRGVSRICRPEYWQAAVKKLSCISRVAVVSGFFVPSAKAPETDGPGGAAIIARAFAEQGVETEIWTDSFCIDAISACASEIGFHPEKVKIPENCKILDSYSPQAIILRRGSDVRQTADIIICVKKISHAGHLRSTGWQLHRREGELLR